MRLEPGELKKIAALLDTYLEKTKWTPSNLADRAGVSRSAISHARAARQNLGPLAALSIEAATVEAFQNGATKVPPLRAVDLSPALARRQRTKKTRRLAA